MILGQDLRKYFLFTSLHAIDRTDQCLNRSRDDIGIHACAPGDLPFIACDTDIGHRPGILHHAAGGIAQSHPGSRAGGGDIRVQGHLPPDGTTLRGRVSRIDPFAAGQPQNPQSPNAHAHPGGRAMAPLRLGGFTGEKNRGARFDRDP